jgi:hypothetical protein
MRKEKGILLDKLTGTDQAGMKEMNTSMKIGMLVHPIEGIGVRRRLTERIVMRRNGQRKSLMVSQFASSVVRKATMRGNAIPKCLKSKF